MKHKLSLETVLNRGVSDIIVREHLERRLRYGKKLRVKLGIDPTAPDIHLGHTIVLRKMRQFQNLGHKAVLIIGDFTAQIGDPSGQSAERKLLTEKEVENNLRHYLKQAGKVIDLKKAEIRYNSEWLKKLNSKKLAELLTLVSVQQMIERNDFKERIETGRSLRMSEFIYPVFQGYDSVIVKADIELGGADQKFNLLMGRTLMERFNMTPQDILTTPLLEGIDGVRKMSKSYGNYIGVMDKPNDMFGKIMAIPDSLIEKYFITLTDTDFPKHLEPREAKMLLGEIIVSQYHSPKKALNAKHEFVRVFSKKETPDKVLEIRVAKTISILDILLLAKVPSKSEARRLIDRGAVKINNSLKTNQDEILSLKNGDIIKIGKRRFFKIKLKEI